MRCAAQKLPLSHYARPRVEWHDGRGSVVKADDIFELDDQLGQKMFRHKRAVRQTRQVIRSGDTQFTEIPHVRFLPRTEPLPHAEKQRILQEMAKITDECVGKFQYTDDRHPLSRLREYDAQRIHRLRNEMNQHIDGIEREAMFWQVGEWLQPGWIENLRERGHFMAEVALISGRKHTYPNFTLEGALDNLSENWMTQIGRERAAKWGQAPFRPVYDTDMHESLRCKGLWFNTLFPKSVTQFDEVTQSMSSSYDEYIITRVPDTMLFASQFLVYAACDVLVALNPFPPSLELAHGRVYWQNGRPTNDTPHALHGDIERRHGSWENLYQKLFRSVDLTATATP